MSVECGHCERDLRGGHAKGCPYGPQTPKMRVLKRFPDAVSKGYAGKSFISFHIVSGKKTLGIGDSVRGAWREAAANIKRNASSFDIGTP